jgi:hypothetical protein
MSSPKSTEIETIHVLLCNLRFVGNTSLDYKTITSLSKYEWGLYYHSFLYRCKGLQNNH